MRRPFFTTLRQAQIAQRRYEDVRRLARTVIFDVYDQVEMLPAATKARETIANTALRYLDGVNADARREPELAMELAEAYLKVFNCRFDACGETAQGTESLSTVVRIPATCANWLTPGTIQLFTQMPWLRRERLPPPCALASFSRVGNPCRRSHMRNVRLPLPLLSAIPLLASLVNGLDPQRPSGPTNARARRIS